MKIKNIKKVNPRTVYAIQTSTGTFIADGLAHHNCAACNVFKHGNYPEYARKLSREYGEKKMEELRKKAMKPKQRTKKDYEDLIEKYKE